MNEKPVFLRAEWRKLIMANYAVDPALLQAYVPYGTTLDIWQGKCYLSLVGFMFLNTRVLGMKIPGHINFPEINLRFYVKREVNGEVQRGVTFLQELVPKRAITIVANTLYNEKYVTRPCHHVWDIGESQQTIRYDWRYGKEWSHLQVEAATQAQPMVAGSEEEFIFEHYWGFNRQSDTRTKTYRVDHPVWDIYPVQHTDLQVDFRQQYGSAIGASLEKNPNSVFLAEGSEILVRQGLSAS